MVQLEAKKFDMAAEVQAAQAAQQHQARDLQQPDHDEGHRGTHGDRADRAPDDGLFLEMIRKVAGRQRNHDCVVTGQNQINEDDGQQC